MSHQWWSAKSQTVRQEAHPDHPSWSRKVRLQPLPTHHAPCVSNDTRNACLRQGCLHASHVVQANPSALGYWKHGGFFGHSRGKAGTNGHNIQPNLANFQSPGHLAQRRVEVVFRTCRLNLAGHQLRNIAKLALRLPIRPLVRSPSGLMTGQCWMAMVSRH